MYELWTDFETYSSYNIKKCGTYRYFEAPDFEALMLSHGLNDDEITLTDLFSGEKIPPHIDKALRDPRYKIMARNAVFERLAFKSIGYDLPASRFHCTGVFSAYAGLPASLGACGKAIGLEEGKDTAGTALINFFSVPRKPTKKEPNRFRNYPEHSPEKWAAFCRYCVQDTVTDRAIVRSQQVEIGSMERQMYILDQKINDRGVKIDSSFVENAIEIDAIFKDEIFHRMQEVSGIDNPNSVAQLKDWLNEELDENITSLNKTVMPDLIKEAGDGTRAAELLKLREMASKTSVKKYYAMRECACDDGRVRGLFQFGGAGRTFRWAGRMVQLQNLPRNFIKDLDFCRKSVAAGEYETVELLYENVADTLSQLIRTALIPEPGNKFGVSDFAAIEACIIAWLSGQQWRLDVFNTHGMIYEASASQMFRVPIESISYKNEKGEKVEGENYHMRALGKIAELALGYGGSVGALKTMGGEKMGLSTGEMQRIVDAWRLANPQIKQLWYNLNDCAVKCVKTKRTTVSKFKGIEFSFENGSMRIKLPSGRKLSYYKAFISENRFGGECVKYWGVNDKKNWGILDTYGGKLAENIVQAIARDLLVVSMLRLDRLGFDIVMHVHDEIVAELNAETADRDLKIIEETMKKPVKWASGLPLGVDANILDYYQK